MKRSVQTWFYLSIISFLFSSVTIFFMPFASFEGEISRKVLAYALSAVFWIGFLFGLLFLLPIARQRKRDRKFISHSRFAFLQFFSNRSALVFDVLLIIGLLAFVLVLFFHTLPSWFSLIGTFTLVFSLEMHGLFNSKNYKYFCKIR